MISELQNTELNIQRLAAQRHLYSQAKLVHSIRLLLILGIIFLSIVVLALKCSGFMGSLGFTTFGGTWVVWLVSIFALGVDRLVLEILEQNYKTLAASIQEEFDCEVLRLPWNEFLGSIHPTREMVLSKAKSYLTIHGDDGLRNWYEYPDGDSVPLPAARVICQRSNVVWDASLRHRYVSLLTVSSIMASALLLIIGAACDVSLRSLFGTIAPIIPIAGFMITEVKQNHSAIGRLDGIRDSIEKLWEVILAGGITDEEFVQK